MMTDTPIYWRDWTETQLAPFQQDQGSSNHCAKYAAATALNLLYSSSGDGRLLVDWVQKRPLQGTGRYTILANDNGSLVFQTANLVRQLARMRGVSPRVTCRIIDRSGLLNLLRDSSTLTLISLTYWQGREPLIARGNNTTSALGPARWVGGHIMIPAAYDPAHINQAGVCTPWGFLSSWGSKEKIYWMAENDFQNSWGRLSIYNAVTVSRSED